METLIVVTVIASLLIVYLLTADGVRYAVAIMVLFAPVEMMALASAEVVPLWIGHIGMTAYLIIGIAVPALFLWGFIHFLTKTSLVR